MERLDVIETPSSYRRGKWQPPRNRLGALAVGPKSHPLPFQERPLENSGEEGVAQVVALVGNSPLDTNVNLQNIGQMPQFPLGAAVETNAQIRQDTITPLVARPLPEPVRALVQRVVDVQSLTLAAASKSDPQPAFQAMTADPLCGHMPLHRIEAMLARYKSRGTCGVPVRQKVMKLGVPTVGLRVGRAIARVFFHPQAGCLCP